MKLVSYLYKKFFAVFIGALAFFVMILSMTDLLMNLWNYISKSVSFSQIGKIMLYYIPKTVWYSVPIAMLFSTAYTLSDLYAKNELTAIFASGVSLFKFTSPLLIVAVFMSVGLFLFEDNLVVPTYAKKQELQKSALHREKSLNNDRIVIMSEEGNLIYKADFYDNKNEQLSVLYIIFRNEDKSLDTIVRADSAKWEDNHWKLSGSVAYKKSGNSLITTSVDEAQIGRAHV